MTTMTMTMTFPTLDHSALADVTGGKFDFKSLAKSTVGGAVTAIVLGLAAQATIGNLFAGMLILSVRPFRVGDRVRLQAGALAGIVEGTVTQLGLLYVTLAEGADVILVPNNAVAGAAIIPLREPGKIDLRARLRPGVKPSELQRTLEENVTTPTRDEPHIALEEVDDEEVVMRVVARPQSDVDGPKLADERGGRVWPAAKRMSELLPEPLCPTSPVIPGRSSSVTWLTPITGPYHLET